MLVLLVPLLIVLAPSPQVLAQLSPALSIKLLNHIYVKVVREVAVFQGLDELVLTKICLALQVPAALKR